MEHLRIVFALLLSLAICPGQNPNSESLLSAPTPPAAVGSVVQSENALEATLYLSAWEVTRELILTPATLNEELAFGWVEDQPITAAMREAAVAQIVEALLTPCDLLIDGELAAFTQQGVQFIEPDIDRFLPLGDEQPEFMKNFRIVVKATTPLPSLESVLMLRWDYFPPGVSPIPFRIADTLGSRELLLTPETGYFRLPYKLASNLREPPQPPPTPELRTFSFRWGYALIAIAFGFCLFRKRWLPAGICLGLAICSWGLVKWRNDALAVALGGVDEEQGRIIAERILEGIYHSYHFQEEEVQYDVLAQVLAEPALTETFLETNRTVESRQREGSQVQVQSVTVTSAKVTPLAQSAGFAAQCQWRTRGQVGHWGHFHDRSNLFTADLRIEVRDGHWRATSFALQNRERE